MPEGNVGAGRDGTNYRSDRRGLFPPLASVFHRPPAATMPPKLRQTNVSATPRTHGVEPRCTQTSGSERCLQPQAFRSPIDMTRAVFRLPAELILEILSQFGDPHRNILYEKGGRYGNLGSKAVERLTVIRRLTMTCWHLRNRLLPVLWKYVEGCKIYSLHRSHGIPMVSQLSDGLYAQCSYLLLNPTIGIYVECVDSCTQEHNSRVIIL